MAHAKFMEIDSNFLFGLLRNAPVSQELVMERILLPKTNACLTVKTMSLLILGISFNKHSTKDNYNSPKVRAFF